jgi:CHAD domain-containing protein
VELEIIHDQACIADIVTRLEEAGGHVEHEPKLSKAAGSPERTCPPHLSRHSPVGDVIRAALWNGFSRLTDHDWRLRLAMPTPGPHDIHQSRVATRRLRSDLKTFSDLLDPVWVRHMRTDLAWVGSALGDVRDVDVLAEELHDAPPVLRGRLDSQRLASAEAVDAVLSSDRYLTLLDRLEAATIQPPFLSSSVSIHTAGRSILLDLLEARWHSLRRQVQKVHRDASNRRLHRVRIKAKQVRYAAEAAEPVLGKAAARTAAAAKDLQAVLGDHHDAVAAEEWLRAQCATRVTDREEAVSISVAFDAGGLAAEQRQRQNTLRRRWPRQWRTLQKAHRRL